MEAHYRAHNPP